MKIEGTVYESPTMVGVRGCSIFQLPGSFDGDLGFMLKNCYLLAYILLARQNNNKVKDVGKGLLNKEMYIPSLDCIGLKKKKPMIRAWAGENHGGQASDDSFLPGLNDDTALDIFAWSSRSDYSKLACLNKKFKSLIGSGYLYKLRRRLGVIEHWVYLACILMPWEAFDPERQRWMRLPRMPCDECFTYADKESLAVGTECPLMNLPRCLFGSSSLGEIAIVAGGSDKNGHVLKSAELYNSELGGMSSHTDCLTCGEEYNIETRIWRRIENMYPGSNIGTQFPPAMRSPPLVAVVNNQLYSADQATNEVKKYDKSNNSWSVVKRLPVRADSSNGWGLAFKACGDSLLVIGGHRGPEGEVIVLHSWEPEDGNAGGPDWNVLSVRERAGAFVYNCAVMGC
ncbi:F-box/kelch-repeat protein [Vitis vinifera]|uniref:F-box/kelch-repeat protein n=1 Tax=Vitis vinifera TaxID=29760 RepID=A0A438CCI4_VITVI|nr:F-box/kelch-repeat protein [Vitis vinifera]